MSQSLWRSHGSVFQGSPLWYSSMVEVVGKKSGAQHKAVTFCLSWVWHIQGGKGWQWFCFHVQTNIPKVVFQRIHQHVAKSLGGCGCTKFAGSWKYKRWSATETTVVKRELPQTQILSFDPALEWNSILRLKSRPKPRHDSEKYSLVCLLGENIASQVQ